MQIQRLTPDTHEDGERLRELRLRSLRDAPDAFEARLEDAAARTHAGWVAQLRDLATFVAVIDGRDVGIVRGARPGKPSEAAALISMWVAPEARRKGVGSALVDAVIEWARAHGFARLRLEVVDDNAHAVALYARKGFERSGESVRCAPPREHKSEHPRVLEL
jgi:GNAT superfamily N-acetyltransferase